MACPQVITGERFLLRAIEHIDCQARSLGSYGYASLSEPGSLATSVIAALLTLFVALYGLRLLFGSPPGARDTVLDVATIGIVLTLAFSWPAFRTLLYDVVLDGPGQIAAQLTTPELVGQDPSFAGRLQGVDDALVRLTALSTGRNTGQFIDEASGSSFTGTAVEDDSGFGYARVFWLSGAIGTLLALRVLAGFLLAIAPLAAAMLFFAATRGLFAGWLRGLVFALVGTAAISIMLALELAVLEPYLADALRVRGLGYATPSAPTELLSLALAFAIAKFAVLALLVRAAYHRGWPNLQVFPSAATFTREPVPTVQPASAAAIELPSRAARISHSVENRMMREEGGTYQRNLYRLGSPRDAKGAAPGTTGPASVPSSERLGQPARRASYRGSQTATSRDGRR
ncbi:hypothetical protein EYB45_08925 [Erythrobacteraceae bacterium CFH 75059]|uniref:type IV secretion system protein n=1 Tax=Qipengyuania thermophila TaxID=2509361 RepID=UPI001020FDBB|nr:type IV secretion system protein [Qipengyuania thermophila]TCD04348.1 hypothetical protein EYB45_08925 [Erythrobacteraceae bacterium CFH 75059]